MLYLSVANNTIKLFAVKKSLLGQYSIEQFEKKFQTPFLKNARVANMDVLASAIKEVISNIPPSATAKEKQVYLIVPQESFGFTRTEVPSDITSTAILSFVKDKAKSSITSQLDTLTFDYFFIEGDKQKYVSLFTLEDDIARAYADTLHLLDLELVTIIPDSLAYFKLFEKTLRTGKVENILYGVYDKDTVLAYQYDSYGLVEGQPLSEKITKTKSAEQILKAKSEELEKKNKKVNRLILSGIASDTVRQDTFTKDVGMWTNPLKRIIPQFYQEYLKMLIPQGKQPFPLLSFDVCFGAFIFSVENKTFSPLSKRFTQAATRRTSDRKPFVLPAFRKEYILFILSFVISFILFNLLSRSPLNIGSLTARLAKPTAVPTAVPPTPTPTPAMNREDVKIKVLNGSGTKGKASVVKDVLKEKKYVDILTGNADNFDYKTTEIQIKKEKEGLKGYIAEDLKDYVPSPIFSELDAKESADMVIVIGQDFK